MNSDDFAPPKHDPDSAKNGFLKQRLAGLQKKGLQILALLRQAAGRFKGAEKLAVLTGALAKISAPVLPFVKTLSARVPAPVRSLLSRLGGFVPAPARGLLQKHGKKILIGVLAALILLMAVKVFHKKPAPKKDLKEMVDEQKEKKESAIAVKGFKMGRFNFEDSLNALGTIKGALEFKLSFEVPGVLSSINYREGERYEEGALLMSLRQDDILLRLKRAQAAMKKSDTDAHIAQDKVDEHEKLFAMGAIPQTTLGKVKLELDSSKYEAEAARLEMKSQEALLEKSNLYAPSAGMIGELYVEEGESITQNTLLGTHIMTEYVYAEFGVVERDVNKIALGQKTKVFVDAYPDKSFEGVIENISPVVAGTSRTATAKVLYSKKNTLVVPTDSLQGAEGEQFVWVVNTEKQTVEKRPVTIGYKRPDYCQVDAGVSEGEVIAISGLEKLEDGAKIRLLETQEAEV